MSTYASRTGPPPSRTSSRASSDSSRLHPTGGASPMRAWPRPATYSWLPHSGQNFVPRGDSVPHRPHVIGIDNGLPHSGQNFPECSASAPQWGQRATWRRSTFTSEAKSTCCTLSRTCWSWASDCIDAISCSSFGESLTQSPYSSFQQISLHTCWPHRWHCMKYGFISSTALASALSLAWDSVRSLASVPAYPRFPRPPLPSSPPSPRATLVPTPSAEPWNPDL